MHSQKYTKNKLHLFLIKPFVAVDLDLAQLYYTARFQGNNNNKKLK